MKVIKQTLWASLCALTILNSCAPYKRGEGCHLDNLKIKGNVTKIETIVHSSMPLTELFYGSVKSSEAISMYAGNLSIEIDKKGNVDEVKAYGMDGKLMLTQAYFKPGNDSKLMSSVIGVTANQKIDEVKTTSDEDGRITEATYYSHGRPIWNQKVTYNTRGDVDLILKEYLSMEVKVGNFSVEYKDSTKYTYLDFDEHDNWTKVSIEYAGLLPKHHHNYTVLRQLTYDGEAKHTPLLGKLATVNAPHRTQSDKFVSIPIGRYGNMKVPSYMARCSDDFVSEVKDEIPNGQGLEYLFMSTYDTDDAYATISISRMYVGSNGGFDELTHEQLCYDKEMDDFLKAMYAKQMAQGQTYILKWLPYSFTTLSGRCAMKNKYYRYGNGSPMPVYCEIYTIPMNDGYSLTILYSYQSNMDDKFHDDFENVIKSISFY